jgi:hypothetical protein
VASPSTAQASSFEGQLAAGPSYLWVDTEQELSDSSGPALSLQLDAGLRLSRAFALQTRLLYDESSWMESSNLPNEQSASVLGLGLGARLHLDPIVMTAAAGAQLTWFPQNNDPSDTYGAGLGPFLGLSAGYQLPLGLAASALGLHVVFRAQRSPDETNGTVYDPVAYQLGLALSFGIDGEPLLGP